MKITRPEIAIMIVFGIMVPTGDNYSDLWLSYKFFTGNYEPAGKFYVNESSNSSQDPNTGTYFEVGGRIDAETQPNYGMMTLLPVLVSFIFTAIHWQRTEGSTWSRLKTFPLLMCQIWPQFRVARILYFYRKNDDRWIEEKEHHEKELSSLEPFTEAVPQLVILLCIWQLRGTLSGHFSISNDQVWNNGTSLANTAWHLRPEGDMFLVENAMNEVLQFSNESLKKMPFLKNGTKELWKKEKIGEDGVFTLRIPQTQKFLTISHPSYCNSPSFEDFSCFSVEGLKFVQPRSRLSSKHAAVDDVYGYCKKENCGLVSMKGKFLVTFTLSVLSAAFGVGKFIKNGPMTLVPRERYGPSFVLGTFFVALNLLYKGFMLGESFGLGNEDPIKTIFIWSSTFLLPQFVYAMVLAFAAFGLRKSFLLFFRFPAAILLPMFTPFTFGPMIGSCSSCCSCCRTASECDCKLAKSPMELSFTFSYINVIISTIGGVIFILVNAKLNYLIMILLVPVVQLIFIGIFHLFEKKCLCCCNFCFPFTKREIWPPVSNAPE